MICRLVVALSILTCVSAATHAGELLINGDFARDLSGWEASASVQRDNVSGLQAARVQQRRGPAPALSQNLTASLNAAGPAGYRTRLEVLTEEPASVRAILTLRDSGPAAKREILAEAVIGEPGKWTDLLGTRRLSWQGRLADATLTIEAAALPERRFPAFAVAAVSVAPDADGDLLSDAEEKTAGLNPAAADSDGDRMTDAWELAHGLAASAKDGDADPDHDGFTNYQEFCAGTDPRSADSFPGRPADPNMNATARRELRYLALLPSQTGARVIAGQHVTQTEPEYAAQVEGLHQATGRWPALLCMQYDGPSQPMQVAEVNSRALDYWSHGGLVLIKFAIHNPWPGGRLNARNRPPQADTVNIPTLLSPDTARTDNPDDLHARTTYLRWLDEAATGLAQLQEKGVVVLWRPCSEMNGGWFWWGARPREQYIALWRHMFRYFTQTKGLHNLIWVYESDSSSHDRIPVDYYYPGDDVVDVVGHNLYSDTWELPFNSNELFRRYPKVYAFPQAGSRNLRDGTWDNLTYVRAISLSYPRASFFAAWNTFTAVPKPGVKAEPLGNGKARVRASIVDNPHARELMQDPLIVTRDLLPPH